MLPRRADARDPHRDEELADRDHRRRGAGGERDARERRARLRPAHDRGRDDQREDRPRAARRPRPRADDRRRRPGRVRARRRGRAERHLPPTLDARRPAAARAAARGRERSPSARTRASSSASSTARATGASTSPSCSSAPADPRRARYGACMWGLVIAILLAIVSRSAAPQSGSSGCSGPPARTAATRRPDDGRPCGATTTEPGPVTPDSG